MIATPTEYKGVVFKSKTEAVMARAFNLQGYLWNYEPEWTKSDDGWVADFMLIYQRQEGAIQIPVVVELKPTAPTSSYKEALAKHYTAIKDTGKLPVAFVLLVVNPFDETSERYAEDFLDDGSWSRFSSFAFTTHVKSALSYRFDLQNGGGQ